MPSGAARANEHMNDCDELGVCVCMLGKTKEWETRGGEAMANDCSHLFKRGEGGLEGWRAANWHTGNKHASRGDECML